MIAVDYEVDMDLVYNADDKEPEASTAKNYTIQDLLNQLWEFE